MSEQPREIEFFELLETLWAKKFIILSLSLVFSVFSYLFSFTYPVIYTSDAKLNIVDDSINKQLEASGLGIFNYFQPASGQRSYVTEYIFSRDFYKQLAEKSSLDVLLLELMDIDDLNEDQIRGALFNEGLKEKYKKILDEVNYLSTHSIFISLMEFDPSKGFLEFRVSNKNPILTKIFIEFIVEEANSFFKNKDDQESKNAINFIIEELEKTKISGLQIKLNDIMGAKLQTLVLANIRENYAIEFIDRPFVPLSPSSPYRQLFFVSGFVISFFALIFFFLIRQFIFLNKSQ